MNRARKSTWEMLCRGHDLQLIKAEKRQVAGTKNAKINNVIYMELYSGAKMVDDKYEKTNVVGSIDQEFAVFEYAGRL
jgi:predicted transcriptional regulator